MEEDVQSMAGVLKRGALALGASGEFSGTLANFPFLQGVLRAHGVEFADDVDISAAKADCQRLILEGEARPWTSNRA